MNYIECVEQYRQFLQDQSPDACIDGLRIETQVESWFDWSQVATLEQITDWYLLMKKNCKMQVAEIRLDECRDWVFDKDDGEIKHCSGEFFKVQGLRVTQTDGREVGAAGWDQPILTQIGYDGGLLGILRKRINGIPHYLLEAKAEPGNPDLVQISPTLQATFSNLKTAHKGRRPLFADLFEHPEDNAGIVKFDQWMSEDGGRLHKKRNRGILVEVPADFGVDTKETFQWLSLWQIKQLIKINSWVNPHVRGIISHL